MDLPRHLRKQCIYINIYCISRGMSNLLSFNCCITRGHGWKTRERKHVLQNGSSVQQGTCRLRLYRSQSHDPAFSADIHAVPKRGALDDRSAKRRPKTSSKKLLLPAKKKKGERPRESGTPAGFPSQSGIAVFSANQRGRNREVDMGPPECPQGCTRRRCKIVWI